MEVPLREFLGKSWTRSNGSSSRWAYGVVLRGFRFEFCVCHLWDILMVFYLTYMFWIRKHDLTLYVCMIWHETFIGLLVVHMLMGLEGCEFEPWLAWVNTLYILLFLLSGGKPRNFRNSLRNQNGIRVAVVV